MCVCVGGSSGQLNVCVSECFGSLSVSQAAFTPVCVFKLRG